MISKVFLNQYQSSANTVAVYPGRLGERIDIPIAGLLYVSMGLSGEIGELQEKIVCKGDLEEIKKEFGDVFWYISQVCMELSTPMSHLTTIKVEFKKLRKLQHTDMILERQLLALSILAGRISEIMKKSFRDSNGHISSEKKNEILEILAKILWNIIGLSGMCGITPEDAMDTNIKKLFSRKDRGVLGGSGDNR